MVGLQTAGRKFPNLGILVSNVHFKDVGMNAGHARFVIRALLVG